MVVEPPLPQLGDGDRLEPQYRGGTDLQLGLDLGGHLPGFILLGPDPRLMAFAVLVIAEIPDASATDDADLSAAEQGRFGRPGGGGLLGHFWSFPEKLPATNRYKRDFPGLPQKHKCPWLNDLEPRAAGTNGEDRTRTIAENKAKTALPAEGGAESGALGALAALEDPRLARLVDAWPHLTEAQREAVLRIVDAAQRASADGGK